MAQARNTQLEALLAELGWSNEQTAAAMRRVATEVQASRWTQISRSHVNQWRRGSEPSGDGAAILCEALSRGLGRIVTPEAIGLPAGASTSPCDWNLDTMTALAHLGGGESTVQRRQILTSAAYTTAGAALPPTGWWETKREHVRTPLSKLTVSGAHAETMRETALFFSRRDQRLGGRAGHAALLTYLRTDVSDYLSGRTTSEAVRREVLCAASELVYLAGWMSFDSSDHAPAQRAFTVALTLAAEADDAPLAGHIMRAAAHQAVDLGHPRQALAFAEGSMDRERYGRACPREKALMGVVHARALAASGQEKAARLALRRAEDDLTHARPPGEVEEPARVFFFGEASLAHETACTLRDLGDLRAAEKEFRRSVRTRGLPFARTHAVTLGYLGDIQARQGQVEAACATWGRALDTMDGAGLQSGRARESVVRMRHALSPLKGRGGNAAANLDHRARAILRGVS